MNKTELMNIRIYRDGDQINFGCPSCDWNLNKEVHKHDELNNSDHKEFRETMLFIHQLYLKHWKECDPRMYNWLNPTEN